MEKKNATQGKGPAKMVRTTLDLLPAGSEADLQIRPQPRRFACQERYEKETGNFLHTIAGKLLSWLAILIDQIVPPKGSVLHKAPLPEGITHGMLYKDVVRIAWPSFLELLLTQLTSMADQMMVGQLGGTVGVAALSAVSLSAQPKFLLMTCMQALNVGSTAMVARFRGQGNRAKANQVFRQSLILNLILSGLFMVLGILFTSPLLHFMGGNGLSEDVYRFAGQYFRIQMYGFVPLCLTFTFTAVLRGIGDTKVPLFYNTAANVINLGFNYVLIYGKFGFPKMEVEGASLATIIGQTCAFLFAFVFMLNKDRYLFMDFREKLRVDWEIMSNVVRIGIPSMIEQLFMRAGVIIYTRTIASLGDISYATHVVCMNIQALSFMTGQAFSNSSTTLMGQSLGKKRIDMAENYTRHTRNIGVIVGIVIGVFLSVFGRYVVRLYNDTAEVIHMGGQILIMVGFTQPFQSMQFIQSGALRGAGDTKYPAAVMFVTVLLVRSGLALLFIRVFGWGLWGAWIALVCDQLLRTALITLHYLTGNWRFLRFKGTN